MNDILKQRLVGALITVALGVVFWPIIFVQPQDRKGMEQQAVPPPPTVSTTPVAAPEQEGLRGSPEVAAGSEYAVEDTDADSDPETGPIGASTAPPAIVVDDAATVRTQRPEKLVMDRGCARGVDPAGGHGQQCRKGRGCASDCWRCMKRPM
ncbi:MAG: hypothetical protein R3E50_07825 [Halioglobus sp.]